MRGPPPKYEIPQNIYIASRFSRRKQMRGYAKTLRKAGYIVSCRWLTDPKHSIRASPDDVLFNGLLASHDYEDIFNADTFILFIDEFPGSRGGCYVELGLALAWGKNIILVGNRTNVFTYLPSVYYFKTWKEAKEAL